MRAVAAGLERAYPETNTNKTFYVVGLHEHLAHHVKPSLLLLQFVAREASSAPLLIVGAYRDVDPSEPSASHTECLLEAAEDAGVTVIARFLHLQRRQVEVDDGAGGFRPVASAQVDEAEVTTCDEAAERERLALLRRGRRHRAATPQHGLHARQQFARIERFAEVIVCPKLDTHDAVDIVGTRRQHDHGNIVAGRRIIPTPDPNG